MDTWQFNARKNQLEWLKTMAINPGFKAYAWSRAKELDKEPSGLFAGIAKDLEAYMQKSRDGQPKTGD